jgi:hypothetical protein
VAVASRRPCDNVTPSARVVARPRRGKGPSYRLLLLECGVPPSPSSVRSAAFVELAAVNAASVKRLRRFGDLTEAFGHVSRPCLHHRAAFPAISRSLCRELRLKLCCGLLLRLRRVRAATLALDPCRFAVAAPRAPAVLPPSTRILSIDARSAATTCWGIVDRSVLESLVCSLPAPSGHHRFSQQRRCGLYAACRGYDRVARSRIYQIYVSSNSAQTTCLSLTNNLKCIVYCATPFKRA